MSISRYVDIVDVSMWLTIIYDSRALARLSLQKWCNPQSWFRSPATHTHFEIIDGLYYLYRFLCCVLNLRCVLKLIDSYNDGNNNTMCVVIAKTLSRHFRLAYNRVRFVGVEHSHDRWRFPASIRFLCSQTKCNSHTHMQSVICGHPINPNKPITHTH